ncbi:MAG: thiamine pyrophosphate-dependent dehydrogenase E1 component subunit alpha [Chloroflexi bacterium]|nr:thiamine pyrophosphate-dependent dehydrogenase E1 component subunit alpha [Chloroflexota bacterium]
MVRIAERASRLLDPASSGLSEADLLEMYRHMLLARALSERMWLLNRMGKAHLVVTCEGHEGAQVGSAYAIRKGHDFVLPYYRDLGVVLTLGMTAREVMLGALNRAADPNSGGRQMPSHWSYPELKIVSQSSVIATQIAHAVGVAHAARIKREDVVAVTYFGDGATSKGEFHESLNWAALYRLPVVFVCENNGYAISVPASKQMSIPRVADRAEAYGIPGVTVDGSDVTGVYEVAREAIERARRGDGPTLIEAITYRYMPHTNNDDDRYYRSREEVEEWKQRDPIKRMREGLIGSGVLTAERDAELREEIREEVDDAEAYAEASPLPRPEDALKNVFAGSIAEDTQKRWRR